MAVCKIDMELVPIKTLIFVFFAGWAGYSPYKSLFQKSLGLSPTQNGLIQAVDRIVGIIGQPVSGAIADRYISIKVVMIIWLILGAVFVFPMIFIPPVQFENSTVELPVQCYNDTNQLVCLGETKAGMHNNFSAKVYTLNETKSMECRLKRNPQSNSTYLSRFLCSANISHFLSFNKKTSLNVSYPSNNEDNEVYGITFTLILLLTTASSIFLAPLQALIDATTLQALGKDRVDLYGYQRLWGSIGFGIVALVVGLVMDALRNDENSSSSSKDFHFIFICSSVLFLITAAICVKIEVVSPKTQNICLGIMSLFKKIKINLFFVIVYIYGCAMGLQNSFFFWYVVSLPGSSRTILGLAIVVTIVSEIPVFILSEKLAKKTSYTFLLSFSVFCFGIRFLSDTLVTNAWQLLPIEILHGSSFALFITALNAEAAILSPEGMVATTVGVAQAIFRGAGFTTGSLLGGITYSNYGPITTFRGMAIICLVVSVLYFTAMKLEAYFTQTSPSNTCDENRHLMQLTQRNDNTPIEKPKYCSKDDTLLNH